MSINIIGRTYGRLCYFFYVVETNTQCLKKRNLLQLLLLAGFEPHPTRVGRIRCQARFGRDTFGRPFLVGPNLVQHIWSGPYLVQPIFGPNPYLVGAIFGPTKFGRCHIWSNQIWSVPYLVHPNLVSIYLVCT